MSQGLYLEGARSKVEISEPPNHRITPFITSSLTKYQSNCNVPLPLGFELLYQPEVVRLYLSILTESQNFNTLEAAAGALQNLSAGNWTVSAV